MKLRLGLPKGSLQEATFQVFDKAGWKIRVDPRSYHPVVDDEEIEALLIRPQEIPRYLEDGLIDAGITGKDWMEDCGLEAHEIADLRYAKTSMNPIRVVLAAKAGSGINCGADLQGKRISTEYVRLTERWLRERGVSATVEFSWGACEMKVPDLADAVVVNTETGSSLRAHDLVIVEELLVSTPRLVANHAAWNDPWKRQKLENLAVMLVGVIQAQGLVGLKMNVQRTDLQKVLEILPALKRPTVSSLTDEEWVAVETVLTEKEVRRLVPELKRAGATGIVEYSLNKVIF
ncbi:MAG: ATP phosphoribosyltransferase [Armatimonadota bacterium]|nr:MAG: ATP phosphoribosyltransferase [Armatimonadota bacterium]